MIGVEHFYLFNHLSEDDYEEVLAPYEEMGIVELFSILEEPLTYADWKKVQMTPYNQILSQRKKETFWLAIIDTDEFIVPIIDKDLPTFLKNYEDFGAVCIHWQIYGTSNIEKVPEGKTMIGTLLKKANTYNKINASTKSIVRPTRVRFCPDPHYCKYKKNYLQVDEAKYPFKGSASPYVRVNRIRLNHYIHRDEEFYFSEKQRRYRVRSENPMLNIKPPNASFSNVEDPIMLRYVPELEKRLFEDSYEND